MKRYPSRVTISDYDCIVCGAKAVEWDDGFRCEKHRFKLMPAMGFVYTARAEEEAKFGPEAIRTATHESMTEDVGKYTAALIRASRQKGKTSHIGTTFLTALQEARNKATFPPPPTTMIP